MANGKSAVQLLLRNGTPNCAEDDIVHVLGVDLGTTNSTASRISWDPKCPDSIEVQTLNIEQPTAQGLYSHVLVPSVVAIHDGQSLVGEGAKRLRGSGFRQGQNIFCECKNEIGTKTTYHRAPNGYRSAAEVGSKVLQFMVGAANEDLDDSLDRVVVTVPASFQAAQRKDTEEAAKLAGLSVSSGDLLDEPIAAFIDYLFRKGDELVEALSDPKMLVVFDFGGGTCDVAVFRVCRSDDTDGPPLVISALAVSRYHRLGGGDIDAAIVHEVLLPQLHGENNLTTFDLGFSAKKHVVEPALLGVAEQLKIGLCNEIRRLQGFGKYDDAEKSTVLKTAPGCHRCTVGEKAYTLTSPTLSAEQFETLLERFLDPDLLYMEETEYRTTCSIFAPIEDALSRCDLSSRDIDYCLMAGGSSLIPHIVDAFDAHFATAQLLTFPDRDSVKSCVSRGAAIHALSLALHGRGLVPPICPDDIFILVQGGKHKIIPKGTRLPHPNECEFLHCTELGLAKAGLPEEQRELRIELVAGDDARLLYRSVWPIPGTIAADARLRLEYKMDANQVLEFRMTLLGDPAVSPFEDSVDKPFTNVVNPVSKRIEAMEIEELLKEGTLGNENQIRKLIELADLYQDLRQREKAIATLKTALQKRRQPDPFLLNKLGLAYGRLGDHQREEKFYRESAEASDGDAALLNLATSFWERGQVDAAIRCTDEALSRSRDAATLVLRSCLAEDQHDAADAKRYLEEAMPRFANVQELSDWELHWLIKGAQKSCDEQLSQSARTEIRNRKSSQACDDPEVGGVLPIELNEERT